MDYFDCKYLTLVGHVQSGKTNEEINYCYRSINHCNLPVIFLTRNIKADQLQLRDRFNIFDTFDFKFNIKILSHLKTDQAVELLKSNGIIIFLCNNFQLCRMKNILKKYAGNYNMCIDEIDFSIKSSFSDSDIYLSELKKNASHILGATATPFAVFSNDKNLSKIKKIKPNSNYFGIEKLTLKFINPCIITSEEDFPLCDMEAMEIIYESLLEKDRAVLLHTVVKHKRLHYNIQKYISFNYPFTVITYNGDGIKVICNQRKSLLPLADTKSLNNYNQLVNKYFILQEYLDGPIIHLFKNYSISEVLQILKSDPEHDHTHISIIAGHLASRGISFVSTDYSLHLTDQYFYTNKNTHGENLLQSLRILGCYKDDIPLTLWCSKKTWKSVLQQNKIINDLVNGLDNCKEWMCKIKNIYIPKPKNPLTRPRLNNCTFNKFSDNFFIKLNIEDHEPESKID